MSEEKKTIRVIATVFQPTTVNEQVCDLDPATGTLTNIMWIKFHQTAHKIRSGDSKRKIKRYITGWKRPPCCERDTFYRITPKEVAAMIAEHKDYVKMVREQTKEEEVMLAAGVNPDDPYGFDDDDCFY